MKTALSLMTLALMILILVVAGQANTTFADFSCITPLPETVNLCVAQEEAILATTVRIKIHGWIEEGGEPIAISRTLGHATIKDGRYLVTHNHPGEAWAAFARGAVTGVSLYKVSGETILPEAPLSAFTIAATDAQTLLLEFKGEQGQGLFEMLGLPSAEFKTWQSLPLRPGLEVAQINWDGSTTWVEWVAIEAVITEEGTPRLQLANLIRPGSSGGGVFWNGYHIANNWSRTLVRDIDSGEVVHRYSTGALNSAVLMTPSVAEVVEFTLQ